MIQIEEYKIITPDVESLVQPPSSKKKMCNISSCHGDKTFYACPAKGCPRNIESPRQQFFPVLYELRRHYLSVHSEKKFQCTNCQKRFGNEVVFTHHKRKCQHQVHDCECGRSYTSRNALLTHAKRKQHKIIAVDVNKKSTGKGSSGVVTVPGILYVANTHPVNCQANVIHPVKCQSNLSNATTCNNNKALLPRLLRILPKDKHPVCSVIEEEKPVVQQEIPVSPQEKPEERVLVQQNVYAVVEIENKNNISRENPISPPEKPVIPPEKPVMPESLQTKTVTEHVAQESPTFLLDASSMSRNVNTDIQQKDYKQILPTGTHVDNNHYYQPSDNIGEKRKVKPLQCKRKKSSITKCKDVYNEISTSAKKLAHMCTQTSLSFNDIEESHLLQKRVNINSETQVNADDFHECTTRTTTDTQTQINYYNSNDVLKKTTTDMHTQIDSCNFGKLPQTLNIDTQTQINSNNFNDILKKLTMDTQTEINSYDFYPSVKSTTESMDTQTEINSYNFNDTCIKSTVETMGSQTEMNFYDFNESIMSESQGDMNFLKFGDITVEANIETQKHDTMSFKEYIEEAPIGKRDAQTGIGKPPSINNLFPFNDNETQTESVNPWLSDFTYQELSTMGTQTNFSDNYMQTNFGIEEPSVLDKSVQLDGMISLNDTRDIVLTESSNISTQTIEREKDLWLNESLLCESSSTQTDYFENLDFMDVDFNIDSDSNFGHNMTRYCKDTLISGNIVSEQKSHMETQTTIPLYDMLDSPLDGNEVYTCMDKNIANIETQTTDMLPQMFFPLTSSIETQTDLF